MAGEFSLTTLLQWNYEADYLTLTVLLLRVAGNLEYEYLENGYLKNGDLEAKITSKTKQRGSWSKDNLKKINNNQVPNYFFKVTFSRLNLS